MSHQEITGNLVKFTITTDQATALDAVVGIMQAGFQEALNAGEMERISQTKDFDQKFMSILAVDVFLNHVTDAFNEIDDETLPKGEDGKPFAEIEIETDDFTALSIYNLCGFVEERYDFLKDFESVAPGLKFRTLSGLLVQMVKLLAIKPKDKVTTSFQAPIAKKGDFLN